MKYLFINSVYGFGSTGRIIADKCEQLKNEGHECAAAYGRTCADNGAAQLIRIGTKPDYLFHAGITRLFDLNGCGSRAATQRLLSQIEHFQPDVIWLHNLHGYYLNIELFFKWLKEQSQIKILWTLHDCWAFTGHCAHFSAAKCDRWKSGCGDCPQLKAYPKTYDVIIADNFYNSSQEVPERIRKITGKSVRTYNVDIQNSADLEQIFKRHEINAVMHFARYKAVGESVQQPLKYYRGNLDSTLTLLETMGKYQVKNLIFSSSATVYGNPSTLPITEACPIGDIASPYGWTKYMIEQIIIDYAAATPDFSAVIFRYFNPVGAHPSGLIGEVPNGTPNNLMPYITQVALMAVRPLSRQSGH